MQSLLTALTRVWLRLFFKPFLAPPFPLAFRRRWLAAATRVAGRARGVEESELWVGDARMTRLRAGASELVGPVPAAERHAILFVHGGAFVQGGGSTYVGFASWIADATGADVYLPDYRLAPEHPYPAPVDDLFAAYSAVLELGHDPARTAIVGDSAGGALAIDTALAVPEMDVASPAGVVLISPWLDLSLSGASIAANARRDPMIKRAMLEDGGRAHAGGLRRSDPRISPLFAELGTLPPILIQVGSEEILLDDAIRFADRAWAAGVEVELQRFDGMWHDFQGLAGRIRVAREALDDVAAFLKRRWGVDDGARSPGD
jgi:monoterpene epsilon-lactone hydrolase